MFEILTVVQEASGETDERVGWTATPPHAKKPKVWHVWLQKAFLKWSALCRGIIRSLQLTNQFVQTDIGGTSGASWLSGRKRSSTPQFDEGGSTTKLSLWFPGTNVGRERSDLGPHVIGTQQARRANWVYSSGCFQSSVGLPAVQNRAAISPESLMKWRQRRDRHNLTFMHHILDLCIDRNYGQTHPAVVLSE